MPRSRSGSEHRPAYYYIGAILWLVLLGCTGRADTSLFYKEAQFVVGSSTKVPNTIYYSMSQDEVMQKPSLGFDYLYRISSDLGDRMVAAVQARLAWNESAGSEQKIEPQLYNFYLKFKDPLADVWVGHDRPAFGLSSYFDSHGLLLTAPGMYDLGFDRDWGVGLSRDVEWGDISVSSTKGSGMPLHSSGNKLNTGRISFGVLNRDNFNIGISRAEGDILPVMGYDVMSKEPYKIDYGGVDLAYFFENYELRLENTTGIRMDEEYSSFFVRGTINLLEEGRLKFELQHNAYTWANIADKIRAAGLSYQIDQDLTVRTMYQYDELFNDQRFIWQVYYYGV